MVGIGSKKASKEPKEDRRALRNRAATVQLNDLTRPNGPMRGVEGGESISPGSPSDSPWAIWSSSGSMISSPHSPTSPGASSGSYSSRGGAVVWDHVETESSFHELWFGVTSNVVVIQRTPQISQWRLPSMSTATVTHLVLDGCGLTQLPENLLTGLHLLQCLELPRNSLHMISASDEIWERLSATLQKLRLPQNSLQILPDGMSRLTQLVSVDVSNNLLADMGPLYALKSLRQVLADGNMINELPLRAFESWNNLRSLSLEHNQLRNVPVSLTKLSDALTSLNLSRNLFKNLPPSLIRLTSLQSLTMHSNDLSTLPVLIGSLSRLQALSLSRNRLKALPPSLSNMNRLQRLDVSNNHITEINEGLFSCVSLRKLDFARNEIGAIPSGLTALTQLSELDLEGNPIFEPAEPEVLAFLRRQCSQLLRLPYLPTLNSGDLSSSIGSQGGSRMGPLRIGSRNRLESRRTRKLSLSTFGTESSEVPDFSVRIPEIRSGSISPEDLLAVLTYVRQALAKLLADPPNSSSSSPTTDSYQMKQRRRTLAGSPSGAASPSIAYSSSSLIVEALSGATSGGGGGVGKGEGGGGGGSGSSLGISSGMGIFVGDSFRSQSNFLSNEEPDTIVMDFIRRQGVEAILSLVRELPYISALRSCVNDILIVLEALLSDPYYSLMVSLSAADVEALVQLYKEPGVLAQLIRVLNVSKPDGATLYGLIAPALEGMVAYAAEAEAEPAAQAVRLINEALGSIDSPAARREARRALDGLGMLSVLKILRAKFASRPLEEWDRLKSAIQAYGDASRDDMEEWNEISSRDLRAAFLSRKSADNSPSTADTSSDEDGAGGQTRRRRFLLHTKRTSLARKPASPSSSGLGASGSHEIVRNAEQSVLSGSGGSFGSSDGVESEGYIYVLPPFAATEDDVLAKIAREPGQRVKDVLAALNRLGRPQAVGPFPAALYLAVGEDDVDSGGVWLSRDSGMDSLPGASPGSDIQIQMRYRPSEVSVDIAGSGVLSIKLDPERTVRDNVRFVMAQCNISTHSWSQSEHGLFLANPAFKSTHGIAQPESGIWMHDAQRLKDYASRLGGGYELKLKPRPLPLRLGLGGGGVGVTLWLDPLAVTTAGDVVDYAASLIGRPTDPKPRAYAISLKENTSVLIAASPEEAVSLRRQGWLCDDERVDAAKAGATELRRAPAYAHVTVTVDGKDSAEVHAYVDYCAPVASWLLELERWVRARNAVVANVPDDWIRHHVTAAGGVAIVGTHSLRDQAQPRQAEIRVDLSLAGGSSVPSASSVTSIWESEPAVLDESGALQAASLGRLLALLLQPAHAPRNFQELFERVVSFLAEPSEVLVHLWRDGYEATASLGPAESGAVRKRLYLVLAHWIDSDPGILTDESPSSFGTVLKNFLANAADEPAKSLVIDRLNSAVSGASVPRGSGESPSQDTLTRRGVSRINAWTSIEEEEMARQLCLAAYSVFDGLRLAELVNKGWEAPAQGSRIAALVSLVNRLANWIASTIVNEDTLNGRARTLARHVRTAGHLLDMRNYQVLMAYVIAWNSAPISRLRWTFTKLPRPVRLLKERIDTLMDPHGAFKNYRTALSTGTRPCVPFLGCIFVDLTFCEDGNPDRMNGLINWYKYDLLSRILAPIVDYQHFPYQFPVFPPIQAFIESLPCLSPDEQFAQSLQREPRNATRSEIA